VISINNSSHIKTHQQHCCYLQAIHLLITRKVTDGSFNYFQPKRRRYVYEHVSWLYLLNIVGTQGRNENLRINTTLDTERNRRGTSKPNTPVLEEQTLEETLQGSEIRSPNTIITQESVILQIETRTATMHLTNQDKIGERDDDTSPRLQFSTPTTILCENRPSYQRIRSQHFAGGIPVSKIPSDEDKENDYTIITKKSGSPVEATRVHEPASTSQVTGSPRSQLRRIR
jgi:hypothetical protein